MDLFEDAAPPEALSATPARAGPMSAPLADRMRPRTLDEFMGQAHLLGPTPENPSFEVIAALLSRCRVYVLQRLGEDEVVLILRRALADPEQGLGRLNLAAEPEALLAIARLADGDTRSALNVLEVAA